MPDTDTPGLVPVSNQWERTLHLTALYPRRADLLEKNTTTEDNMVRSVYKFNFDKRIPMDDIEDSLMLAALAAESLHGRAAMKIEAGFHLNKRHRVCVIDAETPIGSDIARILTAFIAKGYGEAFFHVERTEDRLDLRSGMHAVGVTR